MDRNDKVWISYGIILKIPIDEIQELRDYLEKQGYYIHFDKKSPYRLFLKEEYHPSGSIPLDGKND